MHELASSRGYKHAEEQSRRQAARFPPGCGYLATMCAAASVPPITGICRSQMTMSKSPPASASTACFPSSACVMHTTPRRRSCRSRTRRFMGTSSTMSTRMAAKSGATGPGWGTLDEAVPELSAVPFAGTANAALQAARGPSPTQLGAVELDDDAGAATSAQLATVCGVARRAGGADRLGGPAATAPCLC
jgi:hypothetical protein